MKRTESEVGTCPKCGNEEVDYGNSTANLSGGQIYFNVECPKCEQAYQEWHDLKFDCNISVME